jgi:hypothetical protein
LEEPLDRVTDRASFLALVRALELDRLCLSGLKTPSQGHAARSQTLWGGET